MKRLLSVPVLLLLAAPAAFAAGDGIHVRTLDNGLRVVVKEDHSKPLAALRVYVGTGGALEMEYLGTGISHYYEHLLSGGTTTTRTEDESAEILQRLGGQSNAYTSANLTCYHVTTSPDRLALAMDLYADWMRNNTLDPNEVAREKGVILKEMNKGEDEPGRVIYKLFMETMYRVHPIRVPNIGYRENFERITRDDLVDYYRNRYAPNNAVLAVAGDVDPAEVFDLAEKFFGPWERRPEPVVNLPEEPRQTSPRRAEVEMDVEQASVRLGIPTIDLFDPDLYALDMVSAILSEGRSSRLFRRIVEKEGLTDAIDTYSLTPSFRKGEFGVYFDAPTEKVDAIVDAVLDEIERLKAGPVTEEELDRAKTLVVAGYQLHLQSVQDQAEQVGRDLLTTGDARFSLRYVDRILAVTPEEVVAAARKYLDPERLTRVAVVPRGAAAKVDLEAGASAAEIAVRKVVLDNGLTLLVKRTPGVAPVGVEVYSLGGLRAEPVGKNGVSFLTARLLLKGTKSRSATEIARRVEEIGANLSSASGNNTIGLSLTLARGKGDLPFAADLVGDLLANATFPEEEFAKEKRIAAMFAERQKGDWQAEGINFLRAELFGDTPYANPVVGTVESQAGITRDDVLAFADRFLTPQALVVAVAGDVDVEKTVEVFSAALGKLAPKTDFAPPAPPEPAWAGGGLEKDRFAFLENDKGQAVLAISFPGVRYTNLEDRAALTVMDAFTSGIGLPSGWFHNALRGGDRSLVYFVHLSVFTGIDPGCVFVYTQTEPGLLKEVYDRLQAELTRLRAGKFTDEELETGKAMALVADPFYSQTVSDVATELALSELYGVGADGPAKLRAAVKAVTREDVMRVVDKYMGHALVTVTGNADVRPIYESLQAR